MFINSQKVLALACVIAAAVVATTCYAQRPTWEPGFDRSQLEREKQRLQGQGAELDRIANQLLATSRQLKSEDETLGQFKNWIDSAKAEYSRTRNETLREQLNQQVQIYNSRVDNLRSEVARFKYGHANYSSSIAQYNQSLRKHQAAVQAFNSKVTAFAGNPTKPTATVQPTGGTFFMNENAPRR